MDEDSNNNDSNGDVDREAHEDDEEHGEAEPCHTCSLCNHPHRYLFMRMQVYSTGIDVSTYTRTQAGTQTYYMYVYIYIYTHTLSIYLSIYPSIYLYRIGRYIHMIHKSSTRLLGLAADFGSPLLERSSECKALVP